MAGLTITYRRDLQTGPALFLELEKSDPLAGVVSGSIVVSSLLASLLGGAARQPACSGLSGDGYATTLYCYPSDPMMDYRIGLTHGELGGCQVEEVTIKELVEFELTDAEFLKYPSRGVLRKTWLGDCLDKDGRPLGDIGLTLAGQQVTAGQPCYGAALVEHRVVRHRYHVEIAPREDAIENPLSAIAWAVWADGHTSLEVQPPEIEDGPCGSFTNMNAIPPTARRYVPQYAWADRQTDVNYCTQVADEPQVTGDEEWGWELL